MRGWAQTHLLHSMTSMSSAYSRAWSDSAICYLHRSDEQKLYVKQLAVLAPSQAVHLFDGRQWGKVLSHHGTLANLDAVRDPTCAGGAGAGAPTEGSADAAAGFANPQTTPRIVLHS